MTAVRTRIAALALSLLAGSATPLPARQPDDDPAPRQPTADGTDCFRALLHLADVEPMPEGEFFSRGSFRDVVLVVAGSTFSARSRFAGEQIDLGEMARVVLDRGGAVLIASSAVREVVLPAGAVVARSPVWVSAPNDRLSPLAPSSRPRRAQPGPEWNVFRGLTNVRSPAPAVVNLGRAWGRVSALAGLPADSTLGDLRTPVAAWVSPAAVGASGPDDDPYRFLLFADGSVLSNGCLLDAETDNLTLGRRAVDFLRDPGGRKRTKVAFFENGQYLPRLNTLWDAVPKKLPPLPQPSLGKLQEWLVDNGNRLVDRVQERDTLNQTLLGPTTDPVRQSRRLREVLQWLLIGGAIWAAVWTLRRVWKARHAADASPPPAGGRPSAAGTGGVFDRRQRELLRRDNLYEPARDLIRELFASAGAPADAGPLPPPVAFADRTRRPGRLRKAIDDLWPVGYGRPVVIGLQRWRELEPQLDLLRGALADGDWRFAADGRATGPGGDQ